MKWVLIRHAERLDHINDEWQHTAHRTHDSPLSANGRNQAVLCAEYIKKNGVITDKKKNTTFVFMSSPLVRCISTCQIIMQQLNMGESHAICVEESLTESPKYIKNRVLGTHRDMVPFSNLTNSSRLVSSPMLLGPGDLIAQAYPVSIDLQYKSLYRVVYNHNADEMIEDKIIKDELTRLDIVLPLLMKYTESVDMNLKDSELVVVMITHGAYAKSMVKLLTGHELPDYIYVQTTVIESSKDNKYPFEFVSSWADEQIQKEEDAKNFA